MQWLNWDIWILSYTCWSMICGRRKLDTRRCSSWSSLWLTLSVIWNSTSTNASSVLNKWKTEMQTKVKQTTHTSINYKQLLKDLHILRMMQRLIEPLIINLLWANQRVGGVSRRGRRKANRLIIRRSFTNIEGKNCLERKKYPIFHQLIEETVLTTVKRRRGLWVPEELLTLWKKVAAAKDTKYPKIARF